MNTLIHDDSLQIFVPPEIGTFLAKHLPRVAGPLTVEECFGPTSGAMLLLTIERASCDAATFAQFQSVYDIGDDDLFLDMLHDTAAAEICSKFDESTFEFEILEESAA